jgi:uncharacterized protein
MRKMLTFRPLPFLAGAHRQTIMAAQVNLATEPPSQTHHVQLPDGDQLALEISTPPNWKPTAMTVILIHGLCGCHGSPYMIRLASKLWRRGIRAVRMNMRGCGSGHGLARQPYHSGRSDDVQAVLNILRQEAPQSPITAIGFSLGGNVLLKWAGESGPAAPDYLDQVIAVCPPADLTACVRLFAQPSNRIYAWRFMRLLKAAVSTRQTLFSDSAPVVLPKQLTLYEFDNLYTAPQCGFRDADEYYALCSAAPLAPRITLPCRILLAIDDPLIDASVFDDAMLPWNVQVYYTNRGGHLGFLGIPGLPGGYRWLDAQLLAWMKHPMTVASPSLGTDGDGH